jgi:hypothetical protein
MAIPESRVDPQARFQQVTQRRRTLPSAMTGPSDSVGFSDPDIFVRFGETGAPIGEDIAPSATSMGRSGVRGRKNSIARRQNVK